MRHRCYATPLQNGHTHQDIKKLNQTSDIQTFESRPLSKVNQPTSSILTSQHKTSRAKLRLGDVITYPIYAIIFVFLKVLHTIFRFQHEASSFGFYGSNPVIIEKLPYHFAISIDSNIYSLSSSPRGGCELYANENEPVLAHIAQLSLAHVSRCAATAITVLLAYGIPEITIFDSSFHFLPECSMAMEPTALVDEFFSTLNPSVKSLFCVLKESEMEPPLSSTAEEIPKIHFMHRLLDDQFSPLIFSDKIHGLTRAVACMLNSLMTSIAFDQRNSLNQNEHRIIPYSTHTSLHSTTRDTLIIPGLQPSILLQSSSTMLTCHLVTTSIHTDADTTDAKVVHQAMKAVCLVSTSSTRVLNCYRFYQEKNGEENLKKDSEHLFEHVPPQGSRYICVILRSSNSRTFECRLYYTPTPDNASQWISRTTFETSTMPTCHEEQVVVWKPCHFIQILSPTNTETELSPAIHISSPISDISRNIVLSEYTTTTSTIDMADSQEALDRTLEVLRQRVRAQARVLCRTFSLKSLRPIPSSSLALIEEIMMYTAPPLAITDDASAPTLKRFPPWLLRSAELFTPYRGALFGSIAQQARQIFTRALKNTRCQDIFKEPSFPHLYLTIGYQLRRSFLKLFRENILFRAHSIPIIHLSPYTFYSTSRSKNASTQATDEKRDENNSSQNSFNLPILNGNIFSAVSIENQVVQGEISTALSFSPHTKKLLEEAQLYELQCVIRVITEAFASFNGRVQRLGK